jgi:hypothetical protein
MKVLVFPGVLDARPLDGHSLWLRFSDGVEGVADLADLVDAGPPFAPLRDLVEFQRVSVEYGTVAWPSGADVAPEELYARLTPAPGAAKQDYAKEFDDAAAAARSEAASMPEVSRFLGIIIRMFWKENEAPHFHAVYAEHVAQIEIETGAVATQRFPSRALRLVEDWRELHRAELIANWERMRRHEPLVPIAPLE